MSQNSSPDNVPSATTGTADSLAAPGRVGAGGTNPQKHGKTVGCLCASCDQLPSRTVFKRSKWRAFADLYAVELLFVQLVAVILNVAALGLSVTKLLGVCA